MIIDKALAVSLAALASCSAKRIIGSDEVPLIGPAFLSNFDISRSVAICEAKSAFPDVLESLFSAQILNRTDLLFGIDVFSASTNKSIYSYFHVGEGQDAALTAGEFSDRTIARIGSVTKLFTTYAILVQAGIEVFSHPVTRYLPELASNSSNDAIGRIRWEDITVGALASHQAGTGGAIDFFSLFPPNTTQPPTSQDFLEHMRDDTHAVISPYRNAVYSDAGYSLLGQVLARLSGKSYKDAIQGLLSEPLGLRDTTVGVPPDLNIDALNRSILTNTSAWGQDSQPVESSGGIYASAADLRSFGLSILNSELLSSATTQAWMKPHSSTGSLVELVGAPWEISRLMIPVTPDSNRTRVSDIYGKAGGNKDYSSIIYLAPDHGIGFSIIVAGETASTARWPLRDAIGETFIPAAEQAVVENAKKNLAGTFRDENSEGTNLTLTIDDGHPGLGLESFYIKGVDSRWVLIGLTEPTDVAPRIFPTGISSFSKSLSNLYKTNGTMRMSHRMIAYIPPVPPRAAVEGGKGGLFDNSLSWGNLDFAGAEDEFIFEIADGRLRSVASSGADIVLKRDN